MKNNDIQIHESAIVDKGAFIGTGSVKSGTFLIYVVELKSEIMSLLDKTFL